MRRNDIISEHEKMQIAVTNIVRSDRIQLAIPFDSSWPTLAVPIVCSLHLLNGKAQGVTAGFQQLL